MSAITKMQDRVAMLQRLLPPGQVLTSIKITPQEKADLLADAQALGMIVATDGMEPDTFMGIPVIVEPTA